LAIVRIASIIEMRPGPTFKKSGSVTDRSRSMNKLFQFREDEIEFTDVTVLGSSNPVFPDYVPHNGSIFSIVDCFKYRANDGSTKYLLRATADYYVIGWNSLAKSDLLSSSEPTKFQTTQWNVSR
jgi:hypothetical protein